MGGRSAAVLLYRMKHPVFSTDRTKSEEEYSTYSPAPSSVAKLLEKVAEESLCNRICRNCVWHLIGGFEDQPVTKPD